MKENRASLEDALRALYAETEQLFAGWSCPASATCCRFGRTGKEPQLWPIEWRVLERALRARPGKKAEEPGDCPAWDAASGGCRAYGARPFGCRTYFCDAAIPGGKNPRREVRELARRLAEIAERDESEPRLLPLTTWAGRRR